MRYWWVNQNQTYNHEVGGGYLWSPKKNSNNARNQFYDNMVEVQPGDLIFSFADTLIKANGLAIWGLLIELSLSLSVMGIGLGAKDSFGSSL